MDEELNKKLFQVFPGLFKTRNPPQYPLDLWSIQCGDGWYELVHSIAALLTRHNLAIEAHQVKEKFAGLRFYYAPTDQYARGVVGMAEYLSFQICEACGTPGVMWNQNGYFITWCEQHKNKKCQPAGKDWLEDSTEMEGIGSGWLRLIVGLKEIIAWNVENNHMLPVDLAFKKGDGQLRIEFSGGDEAAHGMVDLVNHYLNKIDEQSGRLLILPAT